MTMETSFVVTYLFVILTALILAIPLFWIFEHDNKEE